MFWYDESKRLEIVSFVKGALNNPDLEKRFIGDIERPRNSLLLSEDDYLLWLEKYDLDKVLLVKKHIREDLQLLHLFSEVCKKSSPLSSGEISAFLSSQSFATTKMFLEKLISKLESYPSEKKYWSKILSKYSKVISSNDISIYGSIKTDSFLEQHTLSSGFFLGLKEDCVSLLSSNVEVASAKISKLENGLAKLSSADVHIFGNNFLCALMEGLLHKTNFNGLVLDLPEYQKVANKFDDTYNVLKTFDSCTITLK
jgi:hypothetical protein